MGRYSTRLAVPFADAAGIETGQTAVDVGSGPGALTAELVRRLGAGSVAAVDPAPQFVEAVQVGTRASTRSSGAPRSCPIRTDASTPPSRSLSCTSSTTRTRPPAR